MGRTPESRARAKIKMRERAADPEWRRRVAEATRARMRDPEIRARHLEALRNARAKHGVNFRGGNGQPRTQNQITVEAILRPLGFTPEYVVRTKGHRTRHKPPDNYKVDFANPESKIAVELDGPSHSTEKAESDRKKTEVLTALGWRVVRIKHGKEVTQAHLSPVTEF